MSELFIKGYAIRLLLEASVVEGDARDGERYYRLEAGMDGASDARRATYIAKNSAGVMVRSNPTLAIKSVNTQEALSSEQSATLSFSGGAEIARDLVGRVRSMDRLRVELTNGSGWKLAFDGFVAMISPREASTPESYSSDLSITANGLWKFLTQSWFNWTGVVQPGYDVSLTQAGQSLYRWLADNQKRPAQDIIQKFIETAMSIVKLKTSDGLVRAASPGSAGFFQFGSGNEWKSAFSLAYPVPSSTLPSYKGPLVGMIQMMAQPDIHECFCSYRDDGQMERPTIIFRPRPFPGKSGDDEGWKALTVHVLKNEPAAKSIMASRSDGQHPNSFHWSQGSSGDSGHTELEQKILRGYIVDTRSIERYGFSSRPVASSLPPLPQIPKDGRSTFVDEVKLIMERIAYQEAPLPELWTRTLQMPLRPGIHPGDVVEDYSSGAPWTGYVSTVQHQITANPWGGSTTIGLVRSLPCTASDYPDKVRELVKIEFKPYIVNNLSGAASSTMVKLAIGHRVDPSSAAQQPVANTPLGQGIINAARARGVPPWVLAHMAHIESSFGVKEGNGGGIMQFLPGTANDLNNQGYDKPFSIQHAKKDKELSLDAAAWYVAQQKKTVDRFAPASMPDADRWAWAVYGYNQGLGPDAAHATSRNWTFSDSDKLMPEYGIYWGPGAMQQASGTFGGLK